MSAQEPAASDGERVEKLLDELVRLKTLELKASADSQVELIDMLLDAGFQPPRIATLIGTTPATVRARRANRGKGKK